MASRDGAFKTRVRRKLMDGPRSNKVASEGHQNVVLATMIMARLLQRSTARPILDSFVADRLCFFVYLVVAHSSRLVYRRLVDQRATLTCSAFRMLSSILRLRHPSQLLAMERGLGVGLIECVVIDFAYMSCRKVELKYNLRTFGLLK